MKVSLLFAAIACLFYNTSPGQTASYPKFYGAAFANQGNYSYQVVATYDKGYAFAGGTVIQTGATSFGSKMMLYKTDEHGQLQWAKQVPVRPFSGFTCDDATAYSFMQLADSGYLLAGACQYTLALVRTDKNGDTLWTKFSSYMVGVGVHMCPTADGNFLITGTRDSVGGPQGIREIKMDINGNILWSKLIEIPYTIANDVHTTVDGGFIIGATSTSVNNGVDNHYCFIRTNATGDTLWTRRWIDTNIAIRLTCIQPTADSGFIAGGGNVLYGQIVKLDAQGVEQWHITTLNNSCYGLLETTTGWYSLTFNSYRIGLQKITPNGDSILWSRIYTQFLPAYSTSIARTHTGGFVLNGYGSNATQTMAILIKTDSNGVVVSEPGTSISKEISDATAINLYPNPAGKSLTVAHENIADGTIRIYNIIGQRLLEMNFMSGRPTPVDVSALTPSLYVLRLTAADGSSCTKRFLKE